MSYDPLSFNSPEDTSTFTPIAVDAGETWTYENLNEEPSAPQHPFASSHSTPSAPDQPSSDVGASAYFSAAGSHMTASSASTSQFTSQAEPSSRLNPYPQLPTYARLSTPLDNTFGGSSSANDSQLQPLQPLQQLHHQQQQQQCPPPELPPAATEVGDSTTTTDGGAAHSRMYALSETPCLIISVTSPRTEKAPSSLPGLEDTYVSYRISYETSLPNYGSSHTTVHRRFRDFVALAEMLTALYPGYCIPPRPSRNALEGRLKKPQFLECRRADLERYLNRLARHPVTYRSQALQMFLEVPGELRDHPEWRSLHPPAPGMARSTARLLWQLVGRERTVPSPQDAAQTATASGDVYRMIHEQMAQLHGFGSQAMVGPGETRLRDEALKLDECRKALTAVAQRVDKWMTAGGARQNAYEALGAALAKLSVFEESWNYAPRAGRQEATLAEGLLKIGKLMSLTSDHSAKHLVQLHDYVHYLPAMSRALSHRQQLLRTVLTLENDLGVCRHELQKVIATPTIKLSRLEACQHRSAQLSAALESARSEYTRVLDCNQEELERFKAQMQRDMVAMLKEFALVQVAAARKASDMWAELVL